MGLGGCDLVLPVDLQQVSPGGARFKYNSMSNKAITYVLLCSKLTGRHFQTTLNFIYFLQFERFHCHNLMDFL